MGLDQYWYTKAGKDDEGEPQYEEIFYHRKFNALEGFMAHEWAEQTGYNEGAFNCEHLTITPEILDKLEQTIKDDKLDPTPGFFFGTYEKNEWYKQDLEELTDKVIPKVRKLLEKGETITYSSWW